jgi:hypothetical protein
MKYRICIIDRACLTSSPLCAHATEFIREEMRMPMPAVGPRGLEAASSLSTMRRSRDELAKSLVVGSQQAVSRRT